MPRKTVSILVLLLLALAATACQGAPNSPPAPTATPVQLRQPTVDMEPYVAEFLAKLPADGYVTSSAEVARNKPFIVDVRQPDEYARGFIAGAVNIPLRELAGNLQALPALDKEIAVVCDSGHRAAIGMMVLQLLGYKQARTLEGGLESWQAAKLALVTAPVPARAAGPAPKVDKQLEAMLDYYLVHTVPFDWGVLDAAGLTFDQKLLPSSVAEEQPETYDQGPSLLVDVDAPDEFAQVTSMQRLINVPLNGLPRTLQTMPLQETIDWA